MTQLFEENLDAAAFREKYELLSELGAGTFGRVLLARQHSLRRMVAVKFFSPPAGGWAGEDAARIVREARIMAKLSHPSVLKIFDAGLLDSSPFLVVEYVDGHDLARLLRERGSAGLSDALRICQAIAEGLEYLHQQGIVHRDLKPANVLLGHTGEVKVSDFGIARPIEGASALTGEGVMLGTPFYMPPEMIRHASAGPPGDIYSLGLILYQCCHGRLPFDTSGSVGDVFRRRLEQPPEEPSPQLPATLATLMKQCLDPLPERRPAAGAVAAALRRSALAALSVGAIPIQTPTPQAAPSERIAWDSGTIVAGKADAPAGSQTARVARPIPSASAAPAVPARLGAAALVLALALLLYPRARPTPEPLPPAPPSVRAAAPPPTPRPQPPREQAVLELSEKLRADRLDWMVRYGRLSSAHFSARLDKPELFGPLKRAAAASELLEPGRLPAAGLSRALMPLHALRLMEAALLFGGEKVPEPLARVASAAFPLLRGAPTGPTVILATADGSPQAVKPEPRGELELVGWDFRRLLKRTLPKFRFSGRTRSTAWWVLDVEGLPNEYVLDLGVERGDSAEVFAFVVPEAKRTHDGLLSMGFDPRLLDGATGVVYVGYMPIRGPDWRAPILRRLELRESAAP